jgi:phosphoribosylformylglycinamidine synthase
VYAGNPLVNVLCLGISRIDDIVKGAAKGEGTPVFYVGAKTGRDGIHGATMASAEFGDAAEEKRPTVQVGDPFTEKCLLEACIELMESGSVVAIQDMGAAGLTCSAVEMGAKGDLGIELDLDKVPCREEDMTAYEMMLSESQERMLMVLEPEKEQLAQAIFRKWGLDFAVVGRTTDTLRFVVKHQDALMADLPIKELGDQAPEYDRPWLVPPKPRLIDPDEVPAPNDLKAAMLEIMGSPDICSRRWVWEQYDHLILSNTAQVPGGDAAVVRLDDGSKALAASVDVTPRYVDADPFEGGKQAVAECWRNLTAVGADPVAVTDNLNFGNPERPEIMGQFVMAVRGIGEACRALSFPVVSGNVSLYNETNGRAILPTPAIGGVGVIPDLALMATLALKHEGDVILLVGGHGAHLGQSIYLREIHKREEGAPPPVDLDREKRHGDFVRALIRSYRATACHDISDGGLFVALSEMALSGRRGADLSSASPLSPAALFAEDQARYVITCRPGDADGVIAEGNARNIEVLRLGVVTGESLIVAASASISLDELRNVHEAWFPAFMRS